MRKSLKILLISAAAAVVLGCCVAAAGGYMTGWKFSDEEYEERSESFSGDISLVAVDVDVADAEVYKVSGDKIVVDYFDNENNYYTIKKEDSSLSIERGSRKKEWYKNISFGFSDDRLQLRVGIPESFDGVLKLEDGTGDISVDGVNVESISVDMVTGDVSVSDMHCTGKAEIENSTGGIKLKALKAENINTSASAGDISIEDAVGNAISADTSTGNIRITDTEADDFSLTVTTGDINIDSLLARKSLYAKAVTGDVTGTVDGSESDYNIETDTATGDSNLVNRINEEGKKLSVFTSTGDVNIRFKEN